MDTKKRELTPEDVAAGARLEAFFKPHMKRLGYETQEELAGHILNLKTNEPLSKAAVSQWFKSGKIGKDAIDQCAKLFGCSEGDILAAVRGDPSSPKSKGASDDADEWANIMASAQTVGLGSGREADEYAEVHKLKFRADSLRRKGLFPSNLKVAYGKGDSMTDTIENGDVFLYDESDRVVKHEKLYVVMWRGEYNAKRAMVTDDGAIFFVADNPSGDHNWRKAKPMLAKKDPIEVIGRIRWVAGWID